MKRQWLVLLVMASYSLGLVGADDESAGAILATPRKNNHRLANSYHKNDKIDPRKLSKTQSNTTFAPHRARSWNEALLKKYEAGAIERGAILSDGVYATLNDALLALNDGYFNPKRHIRIAIKEDEDGSVSWRNIQVSELSALCPAVGFGSHRNTASPHSPGYKQRLKDYEEQAAKNGGILVSGKTLSKSSNHTLLDGYYATLNDALIASKDGYFNPQRQIRIVAEIQDGTVSWKQIDVSELAALCQIGNSIIRLDKSNVISNSQDQKDE